MPITMPQVRKPSSRLIIIIIYKSSKNLPLHLKLFWKITVAVCLSVLDTRYTKTYLSAKIWAILFLQPSNFNHAVRSALLFFQTNFSTCSRICFHHSKNCQLHSKSNPLLHDYINLETILTLIHQQCSTIVVWLCHLSDNDCRWGLILVWFITKNCKKNPVIMLTWELL